MFCIDDLHDEIPNDRNAPNGKLAKFLILNLKNIIPLRNKFHLLPSFPIFASINYLLHSIYFAHNVYWSIFVFLGNFASDLKRKKREMSNIFLIMHEKI